VEPLEFHGVDPSTVSHIDDDLDWVNASIPVPTPVFQTPPVADRNPVNNQLAETLRQLSENLNRGSAPKPHQSKACIPDIFDGSDPHKLNHFLFQCRPFFRANPSQFSTNEEKINFALTYLSGVVQDWFEVASFQAMYQLAITFDNRYWERNCEQDRLRNTEKDAADSHNRKQRKMAQFSASSQSSAPSRP